MTNEPKKLLVLQSAPLVRPAWIDRCLASVEAWAGQRGIERRFIGDELFDPVPPEWRAAAGPEKLPVTDYARLLWIRRLLDEGHDQIVWLDADILMLDPAFVPPPGDFFSRELWVYRLKDGRDAALDAVNNCAMGFTAQSPLLSWYLSACADAPEAGPVKRLALGPDMLKRRHRLEPLPLTEAIPTLSPRLVYGILRGDEALLDTFRWEWPAPIAAAHLCSSLGDKDSPGGGVLQGDAMDELIEKLQTGLLHERS